MKTKLKENKTNSLGLKYDREGDSLYLIIKKGIEDSFIELVPGINLELNKEREIIGF